MTGGVLLSRRWAAFEICFAGIVTACVVAWLHRHQSVIPDHEGQGNDGVSYYLMAKQWHEGAPLSAGQPYVYRVLPSWLAQIADSANFVRGFQRINAIFNVASAMLTVALLQFFTARWGLRLFLAVLYLGMPLGALRFGAFYPCLPDPALQFFLLSFLYVACSPSISRHRALQSALLSALSVLGVLCHESFLALPLSYVFFSHPFAALLSVEDFRNGVKGLASQRSTLLFHCLPLLLAILVRTVVVRNTNYAYAHSSFAHALKWLWDKPAPRYVHGVFYTLTPLAPLALLFPKDTAAFAKSHGWIVLYVVLCMLLAWVGGEDTERMLLRGAPALLIWLAFLLERNVALVRPEWTWPGFLLVVAASHRWLWLVPSETAASATQQRVRVLLSPQGSDFAFGTIKSLDCPLHVSRVCFFQNVVLALMICLMVLWRKRRAER